MGQGQDMRGCMYHPLCAVLTVCVGYEHTHECLACAFGSPEHVLIWHCSNGHTHTAPTVRPPYTQAPSLRCASGTSLVHP